MKHEITPHDMEAIVAGQSRVYENDFYEKLKELQEEFGEAYQSGFLYEHNGATKEELDHFKEELGDAFWTIIACANEFGWSLEEVFEETATKNLTRFNQVIKDELMAGGLDRIEAYQEAKRRNG